MTQTDKPTVLVVDDMPDQRILLSDLLGDDYQVRTADNGEAALHSTTLEPLPKVILMDVAMPGLDGYEACRRLKEDPATQSIDVIFVSAHDTSEEKLAGYDAGGSDYLTKPIEPNELLRKVAVAIHNQQTRQALTDEKNTIYSGFMEVLTSSGEQGIVIQFLRESYAVSSPQELADLITRSMQQYDLRSVSLLRTRAGEVMTSSDRAVSPLERELLARAMDHVRIMQQGRRLILNYGNISTLIKNLPDDEVAQGRLRDHLAILLEGADARLDAIELASREKARSAGLHKLVGAAQQELLEIRASDKQHKQTTIQIMEGLLKDLEATFMSWGLTEDQEERLVRVVENGIETAMNHFDEGQKLDNRFEEILKKFAVFAKA